MLKNSAIRYLLILNVLAFLVLACGKKEEFEAAPINDEPTLQKLATAYTAVRAELPVSPSGLNSPGKRKFLEKVFTRAGFSYHKTLLLAAQTPEKNRSPYYKDLKELILMPTTGLDKTQYSEVFSQDEIEAIEKIGN